MAKRDDNKKLDWSLLPIEVLEEAIRVLMYGRDKYGANNWRTAPYLTREQITNSLKRHQADMEKGETYDKESGLRHSAHVLVNAMFQNYYEIKGLLDPASPLQSDWLFGVPQPDLNEKIESPYCQCCFNYH